MRLTFSDLRLSRYMFNIAYSLFLFDPVNGSNIPIGAGAIVAIFLLVQGQKRGRGVSDQGLDAARRDG